MSATRVDPCGCDEALDLRRQVTELEVERDALKAKASEMRAAYARGFTAAAEAQRERCADEFEKAARQEPDDPTWLDIAADIRNCSLVTLPKGEA